MSSELGASKNRQDEAVPQVKVSEERYRAICELTSDLAYSLTVGPQRELTVEWIGGALKSITGYTFEEIGPLGAGMALIHPDDLPLALKYKDRLVRGRRVAGELRIVAKNGDLKWLRVAGRPEFDEAGRVVRIFGAAQDVTMRRRVEGRGLKEFQRLKALYAGAQELSASLDMHELASNVVRTCVEDFGVRLAWLSEAQPDGRVVLLEHFPARMTYPEKITVRWDDSPEGKGPTGRAIRDGRPVVSRDLRNDPKFEVWRKAARAEGFRSSAAFPLISRAKSFGALNLYSDHEDFFDAGRVEFIQAYAHQAATALEKARLFESAKDELAERRRAEKELQQSLEKLRRTMGSIIFAMAKTVETRDPYTAGHQQRVSQLARAIAQEMELPDGVADGIEMAAVIHDIGKMNVPAEILSKPGRITETEFNLIKVHPEASHEILKLIEFPWPVAQIVLQHHERLDGSGYPAGLTRDQILLEARIIAVADVVEAMSSHRPFRPALGTDTALEEVSRERDILYDPHAVDACLQLFGEKGFTFERGVEAI